MPTKHYLDVIIQPTYTFSSGLYKGDESPVKGKPVLIAFARGAAHPTGNKLAGTDF